MNNYSSFFKRSTGLLILILLVSACATQNPGLSTQSTSIEEMVSAPDGQATFFQSSGGVDPRTSGYWLLWNSCAEGNQSSVAKANGGHEAGWILLDDLLSDPGVLIGRLQVKSCEQAINLLQGRDLQDVDRTNDPAYKLASQLLTAQLNLASGSEYCQASDEAVTAAQYLLLGLDFDATTGYLGPPRESPDTATALQLADQLTNYNLGNLCK